LILHIKTIELKTKKKEKKKKKKKNTLGGLYSKGKVRDMRLKKVGKTQKNKYSMK